MNDFISAFHRHNFHTAYFTYKGKRLEEILDQISDPDYDLEPW